MRDTRAAESAMARAELASAHGRSGTSRTTASSVALSCDFAGDGIEGIAPDEVEAGWWVTGEPAQPGNRDGGDARGHR